MSSETEDLQLTPEEIAAMAETDEALMGQAEGREEATREPEAEEEPAQAFLPPLAVEVDAEADAKLAAISSARASLTEKFDDGEITAREYSAGLDALAGRKEEIVWNSRKAELAEKMQDQQQTNQWNKAVHDFFKGDGKAIVESRAALVAFDEVVKAVTSDPANVNLSDKEQLAKAHKQFNDDIAKAFGRANGQSRLFEPDASGDLGVDTGRFAALDRMADSDPLAYEAAIGKMSDAERDVYMRSL